MTLAPGIDASLERGLGFVLAAQDGDGGWTDWELPPGPSPHWTTAHVGLRLCSLNVTHRAALAEPLERAACWLQSHQAAGGGWGYNQSVEPDADSTSQALLFLAAAEAAVPQEACSFLAGHQQPDGGFATYLPDGLTGSWGISHPEITPVALLALHANPDVLPRERIARGVEWMRRTRRPDGLWNSFWWSTPLPATETSLALFVALGSAESLPCALARWNPADSLQAALLLSITCTAAAASESAQVERLACKLLSDQNEDGSWASGPSLRVTARDCKAPWDTTDCGPLFADTNRLHTTATAVAALSRAKRMFYGRGSMPTDY